MKSDINALNANLQALCTDLQAEYMIDPHSYDGDTVKRGLRNADGTG